MGWTCPVRSALKWLPVQDFNSFSITTFLAPHIKELETYFALLYFWTFAQCYILKRLSSLVSVIRTVGGYAEKLPLHRVFSRFFSRARAKGSDLCLYCGQKSPGKASLGA